MQKFASFVCELSNIRVVCLVSANRMSATTVEFSDEVFQFFIHTSDIPGSVAAWTSARVKLAGANIPLPAGFGFIRVAHDASLPKS